MAWEDGNVDSIYILIDAADGTTDKGTARNFLNQALSSANCVKDAYQRKNLIKLIEDKIRDL